MGQRMNVPEMTRTLALLLGITILATACGCGGSTGNNVGSRSNGTLSATITANHFAVSLGQSIILNWSSTNATSCLATSAPVENDWTALVGTSGSATVTPGAFGGEIYSLTCTDPSGATATASTSIKVNSAASGIINGDLNTNPPTVWLGNNCVLGGHAIHHLTITGIESIGQFYDGDVAAGAGFGGGGIVANWTATSDGTGMLMNYTTSQCPNTPKIPNFVTVPVSLLNISGSAATGQFSGKLVDQKGDMASCSFALATSSTLTTICVQ
jgi:hypothetical protein